VLINVLFRNLLRRPEGNHEKPLVTTTGYLVEVCIENLPDAGLHVGV
jgi:hypothetical protein